MASDLTQEELQRVGRRLERLRLRNRRSRLADGLLLPLDELDASFLQLPLDLLDLDGVEVEELDSLLELGRLEDPRRFSTLEELVQIFVVGDEPWFVSHAEDLSRERRS
jgi:hypothetical protein